MGGKTLSLDLDQPAGVRSVSTEPPPISEDQRYDHHPTVAKPGSTGG
jgi:hypothetical protein